ncbi:uncharacterized protein PV06_00412 [Exophiala oligosperma]|uniref:Myb-like domain-containing protein n=1 Tax=Exophiala oligosperma TaxID=215243 RepID=A0A0D2CCV3_9EURO|nr:uncharacterized protein PV06_00412 [Exophiala oligosperma]KIW47747.1 hypothetical protein PV06_00412 [Exophiala oligosperma]
MSNLFNAPWSNAEKVALLTYILEGAGVDVPAVLLHSINSHALMPMWNDITLPPGRSLNACRKAYEDMMAGTGARSFSSMAVAPFAPQQFDPHAIQGRTASGQEPQPPTHRSIKPRPPRSTESPMASTTATEGFTILGPYAPDTGIERRKKRGRPTKEEVEERERRLALVGQTYEPKKRPAKKPRPSETPVALSESLAGTSPTLQTPVVQRTEPREETSSGKRKSRRRGEGYEPFSSQAAAPPRASPGESVGERSTDAAQSPSDRLLHRSSERAQAVTALSRDIQQDQSPNLEGPVERSPEGRPSGPPSV